jgi:hypothetical protein
MECVVRGYIVHRFRLEASILADAAEAQAVERLRGVRV